ncbi:RHS repeat-associated core domain-containing protein [bacterium 1XD42-54]|nr:RHS repeat-associated core domain-containing protein [bacterium 1XD42-54]
MKSSYRYTPFGEQVCTDGEKAQEEFLYNAEAYDAVSGSYYMRVRFYEPAAMRFYQPDIVRGDVKKPQSLNRYVYVQNNPVMYEDTSGESVLPAFVGAGAIVLIGSNYVMNRGKNTTGNKTASKTTKGYTQSTKGGITWKAVENMVVQSPIVQFGANLVNQVKSNLTETQQKAVKQAQEVWKAIPFSTGKDVKVLNEKLSKACIAFIENGKEKTKEDIINEAVKYAIDAEDFGPLVDSEWEEYYDEDTLAEIRKRLQMYYFDHPEEHERIWEKYYKQDKRTWPEKGLLALELVGGAYSVYSGIGLVSSVSGAIGGGVGGSLALAGGGTVSGVSSVAVSDLLVGAVGVAGSIAGGEAIVHGVKQITGIDGTKHGNKRMNERGFTETKVNDIINNYSQKLYQEGGKTVYVKKNGKFYDVIITNSEGQVVTAVGGNTKSLRNWKDVVQMLNNNGGFSTVPY